MPLYRIDEKLVFFVHIPKTGGSSIEKSLERVGKVCFSKHPDFLPTPAQHFHAEMFNALISREFYDKGFAVCRNPYTRLISEYRHQVVRGRIGSMSLNRWIAKTLRKYRGNAFLHHNHIRPQAEFVCDSIDVYKFEEGVDRVVQEICAYCGISIQEDVPRIKSFEKNTIELSSKLLDQIQSFYQTDFDAFEYDPTDLSFAEASKIVLV